MASSSSGSGRSKYAEAVRLAKRGVPIAIDLYRRWQQLPPETRERYLRTAREYARKAGDAYAERRGQLGGKQQRRPKRRRSV
jgi:acyl-CoA reductase-like NAD-dependent aldehyde dehydrogenase